MTVQHILALWLTLLVGLGYLALVWWLDRYEKEPLWLLGLVFGWGALGASVLAYIGELALAAVFPFPESMSASLVPDIVFFCLLVPVVEEVLKGLAPVVVLLAFERQIDDPLDGLVYGAASGLGFGLSENLLYLLFGTANPLSLFFLRSVLFGAMHGLFTGLFGLGIGYAKTRGRVGLFLGLGFGGAVAAHALHNLFALLGSVGFGLRFYLVLGAALILLALKMAARERGVMERFLKPELEAGHITQEEFKLALSGKLGLLANEFSRRRKLKSLLARLAFRLKEGDYDGAQRLREEIARLRN